MTPTYERSVFINCPFDPSYRRLFYATVFTVLDCGFVPRCALEAEDGGEVRIIKIKRIIRECGFGIHDISRVQLDRSTGLPRFNMPLELGLFLGAQEYGTGRQKQKRSLVLDTEPYRYQKFCSDIAGQDIRAHRNQIPNLIAAVRGMLATAANGEGLIPGPAIIRERHERCLNALPKLCEELHVRFREIQFVELRSFIQSWLGHNPL